jgi:hypothetical protein
VVRHRKGVTATERGCEPLRSPVSTRRNRPLTCGDAAVSTCGRQCGIAGACTSKRAHSEPSCQRAPTDANAGGLRSHPDHGLRGTGPRLPPGSGLGRTRRCRGRTPSDVRRQCGPRGRERRSPFGASRCEVADHLLGQSHSGGRQEPVRPLLGQLPGLAEDDRHGREPGLPLSDPVSHDAGSPSGTRRRQGSVDPGSALRAITKSALMATAPPL